MQKAPKSAGKLLTVKGGEISDAVLQQYKLGGGTHNTYSGPSKSKKSKKKRK